MSQVSCHVRSAVKYGKRIYLSCDFQYDVDEELTKQANKIILDYLKLAKVTLKIMGASSKFPLVKQEFAKDNDLNSQWKYNRYLYVEEAVLDFDQDCCDHNLDIIQTKKVDAKSLASVFNPVRTGSQEKTNVFNRFKRHWQPQLILALANVKLEVPIR
jgi:hypothetical protein